MKKGKFVRSVALVCALALPVGTVAVTAPACGGRLAAPEQLSPVGDIAYHARRVVGVVNELQAAAIEGEASGAVKADDARAIVEATKLANTAGVDLAKALKAGASGVTAKEQAVKTIREALINLPERLSPEARKIAEGYITVALTFLSVFA